jgi:hypothetical protein
MNNTASDKGFNLTEIFTSIKSKSSWTDDETKTFLLFLECFSKNSKFIKPNFTGIIKSDNPVNKVQIPMERFNKITSFGNKSKKNKSYYQEFRKLRTNLTSKSISLPHPIETSNRSSIERSLFITAEYNAQEDSFDLTLHNDLVERFEFYTKYIKNFSLDKIENSSNDYAIRTYIYLKGLIDIYKLNEVIISLNDYKEILTIKNKYTQITALKTYVLDVLIQEIKISDGFDINIEYELLKTGRAYTKIKFTFNYKKQTVIEAPKKEISEKPYPFGFNQIISDDDYDETSIFEETLFSWGIRSKRIAEIEHDYSLETIQKAIEVTEQADKDKIIKGAKSGYFLGTLVNKHFKEEEIFNRDINASREKEEKAHEQRLMAEKEGMFQSLQSVINLYENEFSKLLTAYSMGENLKISDVFMLELDKIIQVDFEILKNYKSTQAVLDKGFYDMSTQKNIRPNIYDFMVRITTVK